MWNIIQATGEKTHRSERTENINNTDKRAHTHTKRAFNRHMKTYTTEKIDGIAFFNSKFKICTTTSAKLRLNFDRIWQHWFLKIVHLCAQRLNLLAARLKKSRFSFVQLPMHRKKNSNGKLVLCGVKEISFLRCTSAFFFPCSQRSYNETETHIGCESFHTSQHLLWTLKALGKSLKSSFEMVKEKGNRFVRPWSKN